MQPTHSTQHSPVSSDRIDSQSSTPPSALSSWIQLGLFTAFLFLLVAIPYILYIHSPKLQQSVVAVAIPTIVVKPTIFPPITPPSASVSTTCDPVPSSYTPPASPAAYLFTIGLSSQKEICFPPIFPPFPFTWHIYTSYAYGYSIDTPTNWTDRTTTLKGTVLHIFTGDNTSSTSAIPTISFAWYSGSDPYATQAAYLHESISKGMVSGTIYTQSRAFIAAVFPIAKGYVLLQSSTEDSAFYAFQYMLDSLRFTQ